MLRLVLVGALSSALVLASAPVRSTTLIVSVSDSATGTAIPDAEVTLPSAKRSSRTEKNGEARFAALAEGRYRVQTRAVGYAPGDVEVDVRGDSVPVRIKLRSTSNPLDTVRVAAAKRRYELRMSEFESRRKMNIGRFLTDSALREDGSHSMQSLLSTRFPGIQARERGIEAMQPSGFASDQHCPVLIYMDGLKVSDISREAMKPEAQRLAPTAFPKGTLVPQAEEPRRQLFPLDNLRPDSVAAVEYYSNANAPVQYRPVGTYCKVILLWTRR